jgi:glutathione synthase/RimK-type ligase-like ATP-grasp enzyme
MTWLILVDQERDFSNADTPHKVMTTRDYLSRPQLFRDKPKIINLARSYGYQGAGYYCSLLAEARGHRIMPPVETMAELSRKSLYEQALPEIEAVLGKCIHKNSNGASGALKLFVCFGQVQDQALVPFARLVFDWFRVPVLRVSTSFQNGRCQVERIAPAGVNTLGAEERAFFAHALDLHTRRTWRDAKARNQAKYSLAVLIDASEPHPPSTHTSLRHLAKVAQKFSIEVEPIHKGDLDKLAEYDALFIRATTSIDNFTYRFARRAEQEGMPVIDDPRSMIRCTNKVYLAERLNAAGVPTPRTVVVQGLKQAVALGEELGWPVVLKIPDGSFSRGVFKCDDLECLKTRLKELLDHSDLVIAQEFVPTDFDWRIGVLAGEPLFACQYHMVKKHWQIMKYEDGKAVGEGRFKTIALDQVPHGVVETAVKAARLMGQGLYGVDLKQTDHGLYVIEVNDNPDLNHGIEDVEEKDALWEKLVKWFWDRLEA